MKSFEVRLIRKVKNPEAVYMMSQGLTVDKLDVDHVVDHVYCYMNNRYYLPMFSEKKGIILEYDPVTDYLGEKYLVRDIPKGYEVYVIEKELSDEEA